MPKPSSEFPEGGAANGDHLQGEDLAEAQSSIDAEAAPGRSGIHRRVGVIELRFTQLMVVTMTGLVLASAITRSVGKPVAWTVDLALLAFAWSVFIGADVALRSGRMVNIDMVVSRLPQRAQAWIQLFNSALIVVFLGAMVGLGLLLSYTTRSRSFSGLPWLSYTWATLAVPIGCAFMLWTMILMLGGQLKQLRNPELEVDPHVSHEAGQDGGAL